jgi:hypothetical protein
MKLYQLLELVNDEESFLVFVDALRKDREFDAEAEQDLPSNPYGASARGWNNVTIQSFLKAAQSWAEATQFGATQNLGELSPWRKFATFLYAGKIYE